jgi:hypothetical protein
MAGKRPNQVWQFPTYWNFIKSEAALMDTDGCSAVTGARVECCFEHDLGYRRARDPRDAYRHFRNGRLADPWDAALPIERSEVDRRFRQCLMNRSTLGRWSPMAWWLWAGVRVGAKGAWERHRQREQETV